MSTLKENLLDQRKNSCSGTSNKKYSKNSKVIENLIKSEGEMMCSVLARERTFCKSLLCDFRKQFGRVSPPLWTLLQTQSKLKLGQNASRLIRLRKVKVVLKAEKETGMPGLSKMCLQKYEFTNNYVNHVCKNVYFQNYVFAKYVKAKKLCNCQNMKVARRRRKHE